MKRVMIFIAVLVMLGSPVANATKANFTANVTRTLIADDGKYGGCMVMLDTSIQAQLPECPSTNWVTLSCSGDFSAKDIAYRKFDSAQMAKALKVKISLRVDDLRKHNGFCYAERLDVW